MKGYNRVVLVGNLTQDPKVRQVSSGGSVADVRLAVSESYRKRDGEQTETTCFVDVVAWGRQAENCGQYLSKGARILVEGRLQLDEWETKEGQRRTRLRVRSDRIQFMSSSKSSGAQKQGATADGADEEMPF